MARATLEPAGPGAVPLRASGRRARDHPYGAPSARARARAGSRLGAGRPGTRHPRPGPGPGRRARRAGQHPVSLARPVVLRRGGQRDLLRAGRGRGGLPAAAGRKPAAGPRRAVRQREVVVDEGRPRATVAEAPGQRRHVYAGDRPGGGAHRARASTPGDPVLCVDQFEELFTGGLDAAGRRSFLRELAAYARDRAPVLLTVRSDYLSELAGDPAFAGLVERGLHLVAPLGAHRLRETIEGPARVAGLRLEPVWSTCCSATPPTSPVRCRCSPTRSPRPGAREGSLSPSTATAPAAGSAAPSPRRPTGSAPAWATRAGSSCAG